MTDSTVRMMLLKKMAELHNEGYRIAIVHGGGPYIKKILATAKIESEFINGQRVTTPEALSYVEMALRGEVNGMLLRELNGLGCKAVGLSGKDAGFVKAVKRTDTGSEGNPGTDLGRVGNVESVDTRLLQLLLDNHYVPVVTCIATDENGLDYNINGDVFAGKIAAALKADEYIVLTDVDGLMYDIKDPDSKIDTVHVEQMKELIEQGVIAGGMIPKMESCLQALEEGVAKVRIMNGSKVDGISDLSENSSLGTSITKS